MLLARTTGVFLLLFFLQGIERVKGDTDPCVYTVSDYDDVSNDPGNGQDQLACCVTGNCTFHSFEDALGNVTNNLVIDIETSVVLSSSLTIENFDNILIRSQINATVLCADVGNLRFVSCSNVTIEGIIWQGCGGPRFHNSSNITIQDCYFHNSTRQAVRMSEMSGDVHIKDCQFTHNNDYRGHGSAIHYSFQTVANPPPALNINDCSFTSNGPAGSVVYISSSTSNMRYNLLLQDSVFINNQGVPIYLSNVHMNVLGTVPIRQNTANSGGGIFSTNSIIEFDNCSVQFCDNSATVGGAIYFQNSDVTFGLNSSVQFENNYASTSGGGIFSQSRSLITFANNSVVTFSSNRAGQGTYYSNRRGGAIYATVYADISFTDNSQVTFNSNSAGYRGGAISMNSYSNIRFGENSFVRFNNNSIGQRGGAIEIERYSHMLFDGNSEVHFNNNSARDGGAILSYYSDIFITGNSVVIFCNNSGSSRGGAIYLDSGDSDFFVNGTSSVTFDNNTARSYGGAIYTTQYSDISFEENAAIKFTNNSASSGGVFYASYGSRTVISCRKNSTVAFIDNRATSNGGVIYIYRYATISFGDSSAATFARNTAYRGGAVYARYYMQMSVNGYAKVSFANNTATYQGGAVYAQYYIQMSFTGSTKASFVNNTATYHGGAVYISYSDIVFNAPVLFQENSAQNGQAVYCDYGSSLRFEENLYKGLVDYYGEEGDNLHVSSNCGITVEKYTCKCKFCVYFITSKIYVAVYSLFIYKSLWVLSQACPRPAVGAR
ncbi:probable outer membrane protein pmp6 [Dysidea avara]|uniref:probable outer membrane protein pmp6 n=1 Tax=Dysidea avara TaxID=196820 RepID=UPI003331124B